MLGIMSKRIYVKLTGHKADKRHYEKKSRPVTARSAQTEKDNENLARYLTRCSLADRTRIYRLAGEKLYNDLRVIEQRIGR